MPGIKSVETSGIGGGNYRTTTNYDNGTSRDVDRDTGGTVITVTDHDHEGNSVSGDGTNDAFNSSGAVRLNER